MGLAEFLIVLAGGSVTTFVAVAIIHMIRKGRALRARGELEPARGMKPLEHGAMPQVRRSVPEETRPVERSTDPSAG